MANLSGCSANVSAFTGKNTKPAVELSMQREKRPKQKRSDKRGTSLQSSCYEIYSSTIRCPYATTMLYHLSWTLSPSATKSYLKFFNALHKKMSKSNVSLSPVIMTSARLPLSPMMRIICESESKARGQLFLQVPSGQVETITRLNLLYPLSLSYTTVLRRFDASTKTFLLHS